MLRELKRKALGFAPAFMGGGGGGGGGDTGAAEREVKRQQAIREGSAQVNQAFGSFDDGYYADIANKYKLHYAPLIAEQYEKAKRELPYQFASTGSSEYQRRVAELEADNQRQLIDNASQAEQFANDRRSQVESQRGNLISQVTAGADPNTAATLAAGASKSLSVQPTFSTLGDLFGKYTANAANYAGAQQAQGMGQNYTPITFPGSGKNVTTVG